MKFLKKLLSAFLAVSSLLQPTFLSGASAMFGGMSSAPKRVLEIQEEGEFLSYFRKKLREKTDGEPLVSCDSGDQLFWDKGIMRYLCGVDIELPLPEIFDRDLDETILESMSGPREDAPRQLELLYKGYSLQVSACPGRSMRINGMFWRRLIPVLKEVYKGYFKDLKERTLFRIFFEFPSEFGYRGDIKMWCALRYVFQRTSVERSITPSDFENRLKEEILKKCFGKPVEHKILESRDTCVAPRIGENGWDAKVSLYWWRNIGIPMLVDRYKALWEAIYKDDVGVKVGEVKPCGGAAAPTSLGGSKGTVGVSSAAPTLLGSSKGTVGVSAAAPTSLGGSKGTVGVSSAAPTLLGSSKGAVGVSAAAPTLLGSSKGTVGVSSAAPTLLGSSKGAVGVSTAAPIAPGSFIKPKGVRMSTWKKLYGGARTGYCVSFNGVKYRVPYLNRKEDGKIKFDGYNYGMDLDELAALRDAFKAYDFGKDLSNWEVCTDPDMQTMKTENSCASLAAYGIYISYCVNHINTYLENPLQPKKSAT